MTKLFLESQILCSLDDLDTVMVIDITYFCIINYHTVSGLKKQAFIISQFLWGRSLTAMQVAARAKPSSEGWAGEESASHPTGAVCW